MAEKKAEEAKRGTAKDAATKEKEYQALVHKFNTSLWKFLSFTFLVLLGGYILLQTEWGLDNTQWFVGEIAPYECVLLAYVLCADCTFCRYSVQRFYLFDLAYWFETSLAIFFEPKMKDRNQMITHHIVTISLIVASYIGGQHRIGLVVMVLHDAADPWMEFAKLMLYQGKQRLADLFFVCFATAFFYTRLYLYPSYVLHSVMYVIVDTRVSL